MSHLIKRCWKVLRTPSSRWAAGTLLAAGLLLGAVGWSGFEAAVAYSNSLAFCTSCHSMSYVNEEYRQSKHFQNASGVRAVCADCHVPRAFVPKMWRKVQATFNEVPKQLIGSIDSEEKFEARRPVMAQHVWQQMQANDSRECRECHQREAMVLQVQKPRARVQHEGALTSGETCIDCHQGIAHRLPASARADEAQDNDNFEL